MIWATISSQSCFCWLYRASPSSAAENIINLILVLTIWWCPRVDSSLVLLEEGALSWQNPVSLCPTSFCTPRPNLPVTPGISWLPTFTFQSPMMNKTAFLGVSSEGLVGLHRMVQLQLLQCYWLGHRLGYCVIEWFGLETNRSFCRFWDCMKYCILDSFVDYEGYSISSKGFLPTVLDIMIIWVKFTHWGPFLFTDS